MNTLLISQLANYFSGLGFNETHILAGGKKEGVKWTTLRHSGVLFPSEYVSHNIPISYGSHKIQLPPAAEEMATHYAKYIDTEYIKLKQFNRNFWLDWKKMLPKDTVIMNLEGCDFTAIYNHVLKTRESKKTVSAEEKQRVKEARDKLEGKYRFCTIDNVEQPVGNFKVEPCGIFIGRGCHPKLGRIKRRIYPEDVTLNLDENAPIPAIQADLKGHKWGTIIHDHTVDWLASYKDEITSKIKYVWLGDKSDSKAEKDLQKFELARKLKTRIGRIRKANDENIKSDDLKLRQLGCALYFIDELALRVGNEKSSDQVDTVGVSTLRVEHIKLLGDYEIKMDFPGKDTIRFNKKIKVSELIYKIIADCMKDKSNKDQLFNLIDSADINKYLQAFMKNLTARVFRTYNASNMFQNDLNRISKKYDEYSESDKINILLDEVNRANLRVAELCNHQRAISKTFNAQVDKLKNKIDELKKKKKQYKLAGKHTDKIKKIDDMIKKLKVQLDLKIDLKSLSLGTSKINYIDARISVSFMKRHGIPYDKFFSTALMERFRWAFEIDANWSF
ncbi:MAG: topoisomerase 1b [Faunusvirus sp.]|jgi:DNA topoisomerase-1|uniref:DNA topoisomerase 1 n=1 Tax=Faunusvirus sp. TaxID=2487766 RepID=A0A3G5A0B0_9VIRU|nr:MAG: topoisomerase 1b [Faunusvirus sp.]